MQPTPVKSSTPTNKEFDPLPNGYYCSITFSLMSNPVIHCEGNTYEWKVIKDWINENRTSLITQTRMQINQLYPNNAIKTLLNEKKIKNDESQMHSLIHRWKNEERHQ